ncbi:MAG: putative transcriptional regulatory protein [Hyphomicrobiales bacterium]|nr:putative transcriptional regulatory protein [Hyphomicrobiales bacterium]
MHELKDPEEKNGAQGGIQVIARAASVLRTLENHPGGLSLGQIAKSVGLARSTVQRIVAALAAEDFVIAAGPGDVRIGPGLVRIAASVASNTADLIRPHLRALGDEVGETVDLAVLSGGSTVFVDQVPGRHRLVAVSAVGERFPLHCTANGKAILACFSAEDADELIDKSLAEHPDFPIRNRARLQAELEEIRKTHLAYDLEEHGDGISAIGIALLDVFGRPIAVSIPTPSQRFDEQRAQLATQLKAFRKRIRTVVSR